MMECSGLVTLDDRSCGATGITARLEPLLDGSWSILRLGDAPVHFSRSARACSRSALGLARGRGRRWPITGATPEEVVEAPDGSSQEVGSPELTVSPA